MLYDIIALLTFHYRMNSVAYKSQLSHPEKMGQQDSLGLKSFISKYKG